MRIEVLLDLKTRLGESPVWDVEQQRLWWVDSLDGRLFACNAQAARLRAGTCGRKLALSPCARTAKARWWRYRMACICSTSPAAS
ncbi:Senescence marker protein-30 [Klebsiella michiganensis]|uniref:Senescence marker protein-30 n=1 Tax=Klebsiella michiganensis TaxID=1134687 RepID=A0A7H4M6I6_9ENTR|nr:Senescence marker protein-30 [Klebsiella michiganensis]